MTTNKSPVFTKRRASSWNWSGRLILRSTAVLLSASRNAAAADTPRCPAGKVQYGKYTSRTECSSNNGGDLFLSARLKFFCSFWVPFCQEYTCGHCRPDMGTDRATGRPYKYLVAEAERRRNAAADGSVVLLADDRAAERGDGGGGGIGQYFSAWLTECAATATTYATFAAVWLMVLGGNRVFPLSNFVDGFREAGEEVWNRPVPGETVGVISFFEYAESVGASFGEDHEYFRDYFTGGRVPSWEDNESHQAAVQLLDGAWAAKELTGVDPNKTIDDTTTRFAFDNEGLIRATWDEFTFMEAREIKYASNGVFGVAVVESYDDEDTLGILCTDSVFSVHLVYDAQNQTYGLDLTRLEKYVPIQGFAKMGGKATFQLTGEGRLKTVRLEYLGSVYTDVHFRSPVVRQAYQNNRLIGWRFAEKAIIASILSLTNLVIHVKDLHLELAAAFQAVTIDSFAHEVDHPVSRLLQPFVHRAIQATNDNFKLLFEYKASEYSLAPLTNAEQLRLIGDFIADDPLKLSDLDMDMFAANRNMPPEALGKDGFWRWHYRASTVQNLYESMIRCFLDKNFPTEQDLINDAAVRSWWESLFNHMPALDRVTDDSWASRELSRAGLVNVLKTLCTWLSWIHEDVGHSAASLVYNPVYAPMGVPVDGRGIPFLMYSFNAVAYRGFVFLNRAKLLDAAPAYWFDGADRTCFESFQIALGELGNTDPAFSECGENGFYSCVENVETGVSS